jgi:hypothetical protein
MSDDNLGHDLLLTRQYAQLFIGRFRKQEPSWHHIPRTTASSTRKPAETPYKTKGLAEFLPKIAVVHGSVNYLFTLLLNIGWAVDPGVFPVRDIRYRARWFSPRGLCYH